MKTVSKSASKLALCAALLAAGARAESLWPSSGSAARSMFADRKASAKGDILTIVVAESAVASSSQSKKSSRESSLQDAISKFIIENSILPRFKANDYPGGIQRGVEDIVQVLTGDAEEYKSRAAQGAPAQSPSAASPDSIWPGIFILGAIALVLIFCATLAGALCNFIFQLLYIIAASSGRGGSSGGSWSSGSSGGGFSGGGGSFGGGGSSGSW